MKQPAGSLNRILPPIAKQVFLHKPDVAGIYMPGNRLLPPRAEGVNNQNLVALRNEGIYKV
jgi:hypothetical protein